MQPIEQRTSNYSTLFMLVLKDVRLERGIHQAHVAQAVGKTPSAWAKIESGQSPLNLDTFFGACVGLNVHPSQFMQLIERLIPIFNSYGWYFHTSDLAEGEDELLPLVQAYFASPGFEALKYRPMERLSIQGFASTFSSLVPPTAVAYCCSPDVKKWIDEGAKPLTTAEPVPYLNLVTTTSVGHHNPPS